MIASIRYWARAAGAVCFIIIALPFYCLWVLGREVISRQVHR